MADPTARVFARLSLLLDMVVTLAALVVSSHLSPKNELPPRGSLLSFSVAVFAIWLLGAPTRRNADRKPLHDAAITSMLVLAVTATLAMMTDLLGLPGLPDAGVFLPVFLPTALAMREVLFRTLSPSAGPVMVVGVGAMGRATAADLRKRARQRVLVFARFPDEDVPASFNGNCLGTVLELESVLKSVPVAEVYLAAVSIAHAEEMQGAIEVCERLGVPFAMPLCPFRLERAQPLRSHAVADGYIHYHALPEKTVHGASANAGAFPA